MAGLVPAISLRKAMPCPTKRDARDKRGHDKRKAATQVGFAPTSVTAFQGQQPQVWRDTPVAPPSRDPDERQGEAELL